MLLPVNESVICSHCVHLKLEHRLHALLKVCSDRDDIAPLHDRTSKKLFLVKIDMHVIIVIWDGVGGTSGFTLKD